MVTPMLPWSPFFTAAVVGSSTDVSWRFAHASIVVSAAHPSITEWFILVFIPRLLVVLDSVVRLPKMRLSECRARCRVGQAFLASESLFTVLTRARVSGCTDCALDSG